MDTRSNPSTLTSMMADICKNGCPVCKAARQNQGGASYWFVKNIDSKVCPFCRAYEKVYGRKAYEPTE